jgi:hypothetical protein
MRNPRRRSLAIRRLLPLQAAVSLIFAFIVAAVAGGLITYNDVQLRGLARAEAAEDFGVANLRFRDAAREIAKLAGRANQAPEM